MKAISVIASCTTLEQLGPAAAFARLWCIRQGLDAKRSPEARQLFDLLNAKSLELNLLPAQPSHPSSWKGPAHWRVWKAVVLPILEEHPYPLE